MISRDVVALLALELFEVITVRVVDAAQQVIRSPQLLRESAASAVISQPI